MMKGEQHRKHRKKVEDITKNHPMEYLCNHPFFLIRWIENSRRKLLLNTIDPKPGEVIADIGCEQGHMLSILRQRCPDIKRLYGIDLSVHALKEASRRAEWERWADKAKMIVSDAREIKLPDSSVDVAVSSNILEHLPDPQAGFDELVRITKPGGRIIINLPNEKRIIALKRIFFKLGLKHILGNLKLITPGHLHCPDRSFIKKLCKKKGTIKKLFTGPKISLFGLYLFAVIEPKKNK
ncbi:class I SAM-dependent methyltransferase [Candidatus Margulisiibacteriota bacterium]